MKKFFNRCSRGLEPPMFWLCGAFALSLVWRFFAHPPSPITWHLIFQLLTWFAFGFFAVLVPFRNWTENKKFARFVVLGMKLSVGLIVLEFLIHRWLA